VIVSNHGGRQLDCVSSGIGKLPEVVQAVGGKVEVLMDGGVRNGIDVVKAVALGASGVLIGRPWVWAAAGAGERGLSDLLGVFQEEIRVAMALMGVNRIDELSPDLLEF
jgi:L-lactate dehydrogenase (cytochrome)